uniref:Uncharacterized protein n=1 Tax=Cacopsylla melanoneura TaxID=428564 RepID=A0A8D9B331_9HEMI
MSFILKTNLFLAIIVIVCINFQSTTCEPDPVPNPDPDPEPKPFLDIQIKPKHHRHHHHHFHHFRRNHPYMNGGGFGDAQTIINIRNNSNGFFGYLMKNIKTIALMFFYIGSVVCTIFLLLKI